MRNKQVQRIKTDAEISQIAVSMLVWNPNFSSDQKSRLRFFLQEHLDNADLKVLASLSIQGQVKFLRERFLAYLAREPKIN